MSFKLTATIAGKNGRGVDVIGSKEFTGRYLRPLQLEALAWACDFDEQVEEELESTCEPVTLSLELSFADSDKMLTAQESAEKESVRRLYEAQKDGIKFNKEHAEEIKQWDRRFSA